MLHKVGPIGSALLEGVLIITVIALIPHSGLMPHPVSACPNCWTSNDDGEFDWPGCCQYSDYVTVSESITTGLAWNHNYGCSTGLCSGMSLQYNPDYDTSYFVNRYECNTWDPCWFQTVIAVDPNNCATFWVQVYDMNSGALVWPASFPAGGQCNPVGGITDSRSYWLIEEDNACCQAPPFIKDVYYSLEHCYDRYCNSYSWMSDTIYVPNNWHWIRSNICWCGENGPSTITFTSGAGSSSMSANAPLVAIGPPNDIATKEASNMRYSCMSGSGTTSMTQTWSFNGGHC